MLPRSNGGARREHNPPRVLDLAGNPKFRDSVALVILLGLAAPMTAKVLLSDTWHLSCAIKLLKTGGSSVANRLAVRCSNCIRPIIMLLLKWNVF